MAWPIRTDIQPVDQACYRFDATSKLADQSGRTTTLFSVLVILLSVLWSVIPDGRPPVGEVLTVDYDGGDCYMPSVHYDEPLAKTVIGGLAVLFLLAGSWTGSAGGKRYRTPRARAKHAQAKARPAQDAAR
jgi:hypothetical protein